MDDQYHLFWSLPKYFEGSYDDISSDIRVIIYTITEKRLNDSYNSASIKLYASATYNQKLLN